MSQLDPVDVARGEVRDAALLLSEDVVTVVRGVRRLAGASVHLAGECALQVGCRGRVVRLLVGQPLRETCRLGSWGAGSFRRMEANR
jgi:hypothetical protein